MKLLGFAGSWAWPAAAVLALAANVASGQDFPANRWRWSNPTPHGNNAYDLLLLGGDVVNAGDKGRLHYSSDLDTWTMAETGTRKSLRSMASFGGRLYIAGESGLILSTGDLATFQSHSVATDSWLEGVAASALAMVAVGDSGAIYSTTNGSNWTRRGNYANWLRGVASGLLGFVAVGEGGFLATSLDGAIWSRVSLSTQAHLNRVAFIGDRFWVVGNGGVVLTNNPLRANWNLVPTGVTNDLFAVAGGGGEILLAGDGIILKSGNTGATWQNQTDPALAAPAPNWSYYSALWDGRLFLAGGKSGVLVEGIKTNATTQTLWYPGAQPTRSWLWSAHRTPEFYAAVGADGTVVTSSDGAAWALEATPAASLTNILLGVSGNTNALVAVGEGGMVLRSVNQVTNIVSTNLAGGLATNSVSLWGVVWARAGSVPVAADLQGVAASAEMFVAAGAGGTILTSPNGDAWTRRSSPTTRYLSSVAKTPSGWLAAGDFGTLIRSPDGVAWSTVASGVTNWIYSVRHLDPLQLAVGEGGLILTSLDGVSWSRRSSPTTRWLNDVAKVGEWHLAAGTGGVVIRSRDAITWEDGGSITSRSLYGLATDGSQLVAVGVDGAIVRNQITPATTPVNILSLTLGEGVGSFLLFGAIDQRYLLQRNAGWGGWISPPAAEFRATSGLQIHTLGGLTNQAEVFRTVLAP